MNTESDRTGDVAFPSKLREERGAVLVLMAFALVVFLGIAALAVDLGLLFVARSEAQRTADAAAHAGAGYFLGAPNDGDGARAAAVAMAAANTVRGDPVTLDPSADIDVEMSGNQRLVRVQVLRTEDSGNPIQTLFARVLGIQEVGVSASAAAEIFTVGGSQCIVPIAVQDRFCVDFDPFANGGQCNTWSEFGQSWEEGFHYVPAINNPQADPSDWDFNQNSTGFSPQMNRGELIILSPDNPTDGLTGPPGGGPPGGGPPGGGPPGGGPPGGGSPGGGQAGGLTPWWGWTAEAEGSAGNPRLEQLFQCQRQISLGQSMRVITGNRVQADMVRRELNAIMDSDPMAEWNQSLNCVTTQGSDVCRASPRVRPVVVFDPRQTPGTPPERFDVANLLGVFITYDGSQVVGRIVEFSSTGPSTPGLVPGTFGRMIRIVE